MSVCFIQGNMKAESNHEKGLTKICVLGRTLTLKSGYHQTNLSIL